MRDSKSIMVKDEIHIRDAHRSRPTARIVLKRPGTIMSYRERLLRDQESIMIDNVRFVRDSKWIMTNRVKRMMDPKSIMIELG